MRRQSGCGNIADASFTSDGLGTTYGTDYHVGPGNRLLADGTFTYQYDDAGNLTEQASDTAKADYEWDDRGRLENVVSYVKVDGDWVETQDVGYVYDLFDRLIGRKLEVFNSAGTALSRRASRASPTTGANIVLAFGNGIGDGTNAGGGYVFGGDASGTGAGTSTLALTDRYLWGPGSGELSRSAVDQILADEQVTSLDSAGTTLWPLADNQGTIRDIVRFLRHAGRPNRFRLVRPAAERRSPTGPPYCFATAEQVDPWGIDNRGDRQAAARTVDAALSPRSNPATPKNLAASLSGGYWLLRRGCHRIALFRSQGAMGFAASGAQSGELLPPFEQAHRAHVAGAGRSVRATPSQRETRLCRRS